MIANLELMKALIFGSSLCTKYRENASIIIFFSYTVTIAFALNINESAIYSKSDSGSSLTALKDAIVRSLLYNREHITTKERCLLII